MRRGIKVTAVLAVLAALVTLAMVDQAYANCRDAGRTYAIRQCGRATYFAPPPSGSGPITAFLWQPGMGNPNTSDGDGQTGTGFDATRPLGDRFIGNDSGANGNTPLDPLMGIGLEPAEFIGGPAGSLCLGATANWSRPGWDGCADNARTGTGANGGVKDDGFLNPLFGPIYGPGTPSTDYLLDAPTAIALFDGVGRNFAFACVATEPRPDENDTSEGNYNMGLINNGGASPTGNNVVPWQPVPKPSIQATIDQGTGNRILNLSWNHPMVQSDNRPIPTTDTTVADGGVGCPDVDGGLVHYVVETAPAPGGACGSFSAALSTDSNTAMLTVPPNTCVRLRTLLGRAPGTTTQNVTNAAQGRLGDLGISASGPVPPAATVIGGPGVSHTITLSSVSVTKGGARVRFSTTSELNVTRLEIYGRTATGEVLLTSVDPSQGTTGLGGDYEVSLSKAQLKGAKSIFVVSQPSGLRSNEMSIRAGKKGR